MASRLDDFLENSPIKQALDAFERGEEVDFPRLLQHIPLRMARIGEINALEAIQRVRDADNGVIRVE